MGISREQALDCLNSDDLVGIGMEADAVRRRLHPEGVVGYTMQARIDCAAFADTHPNRALEHICQAISQATDKGVASVRLLHCSDAVGIEALLRAIRQRYPSMWLEALSIAEVRSLASALGLSMREALAPLTDAGLDSIADDGLILANEPTRSAPLSASDWLEVHRAAHGLGMRTTAGMVFGAGETLVQRVDFLVSVWQLQQETGGFAAFAPIAAPAPGGRELDGVTAVERLKTLAITRMLLDNVDTVQADATPQGLKVLQTCLRFGANDLGSIALDDRSSEEDIGRVIRDAGFRPIQRQMGYRAMLLA